MHSSLQSLQVVRSPCDTIQHTCQFACAIADTPNSYVYAADTLQWLPCVANVEHGSSVAAVGLILALL